MNNTHSYNTTSAGYMQQESYNNNGGDAPTSDPEHWVSYVMLVFAFSLVIYVGWKHQKSIYEDDERNTNDGDAGGTIASVDDDNENNHHRRNRSVSLAEKIHKQMSVDDRSGRPNMVKHKVHRNWSAWWGR